VQVERMPTSALQDTVDRHVAEDGMHFLHPFDDLHLIAGYARYCGTCYKFLVLVPGELILNIGKEGGALSWGRFFIFSKSRDDAQFFKSSVCVNDSINC